ncbi:MAG: SGNH/GDSL hydrolase family protein [Pseudomonadota bacterium]
MGLRVLLAGAASAALTLCAAAGASTFSGVVVIGDSIVDSGNANAGSILAGTPTPTPAPPYFQGRFSNGFNYADLISLELTGSPATALLETTSPVDLQTNYAVGGAGASLDPYQGIGVPDSVPDLAEQVSLYINGGLITGIPVPSGLDTDALHIINIGGNDFIAAAAGIQDIPTLINNASVAVDAALLELVGAGANNILISNVTSLVAGRGATPADQAALAASVAAYNAFLESRIATINATNPGANVNLFDVDALTLAIVDDLPRFGFDPAFFGQACIESAAALALDCAGYTDFDGVHPTAAVHRIYAQAALDTLGISSQPVPVPGALPLMAGGLVLMWRRRQKA